MVTDPQMADIGDPAVDRFWMAAFDIPDDTRRVYREPHRIDLIYAMHDAWTIRNRLTASVNFFREAGRYDVATTYEREAVQYRTALRYLVALRRQDNER